MKQENIANLGAPFRVNTDGTLSLALEIEGPEYVDGMASWGWRVIAPEEADYSDGLWNSWSTLDPDIISGRPGVYCRCWAFRTGEDPDLGRYPEDIMSDASQWGVDGWVILEREGGA
jgi:hypothetical protein